MLRRTAFTLIELLVVMAVLGVMVAILLPAISNARESARTVVCLNSLRQTLLAANAYVADFREFPDMRKPSAVNNTPHSNHPQFKTGIVNRDGACATVDIDYFTVNGIPNRPKWYSLLSAWQDLKSTTAYACNAQRGDFSRNGNPIYTVPYIGFGNGDKTNAYYYFGPLVHWDDVNPQTAPFLLAAGLLWVSDAPIDATTGWPANWDLRAKNSSKGVLFCCPSPAYDGAGWGGPRVGGYAHWDYPNGDFVMIRPHGASHTIRNYGFTDGHAVTLEQKAVEGYTAVGIGYSWSPSPNGYY